MTPPADSGRPPADAPTGTSAAPAPAPDSVESGAPRPGRLEPGARSEARTRAEPSARPENPISVAGTPGCSVLIMAGRSRGEPGPAAAGVALLAEDGRRIAEDCIYLGRMTNLAAEYHALVRGLQVAGQRGVRELSIRCSNPRIAEHVRGTVPVRNPSVSPMFQLAGQLLRSFRRWDFEIVAAEDTARAMALVDAELDRRDGVRVFSGAGNPAMPATATKAIPNQGIPYVTGQNPPANPGAGERGSGAAGSGSGSGVTAAIGSTGGRQGSGPVIIEMRPGGTGLSTPGPGASGGYGSGRNPVVAPAGTASVPAPSPPGSGGARAVPGGAGPTTGSFAGGAPLQSGFQQPGPSGVGASAASPTGGPGPQPGTMTADESVPGWSPVRAEVLRARPRIINGRCDLAVGTVFEFGRTAPAGMPLLTLATLLPYVLGMQRGAGFEYTENGELQVSCASEFGYYLVGLRRNF